MSNMSNAVMAPKESTLVEQILDRLMNEDRFLSDYACQLSGKLHSIRDTRSPDKCCDSPGSDSNDFESRVHLIIDSIAESRNSISQSIYKLSEII
jgi:hypothetical protein